MHKTKLAPFLILFAASLWSQQAKAPFSDFDALPPAVRAPHSTKMDLAVPLCPATFNDSIETDGVVSKDDKTVTSPKVKRTEDARFSPEARQQKKIKHFEMIVSLVVDATGSPQNVCLKQSVGYGLDAKAADAIEKYEFIPAHMDDKPVAVRIYTKVEFNLY